MSWSLYAEMPMRTDGTMRSTTRTMLRIEAARSRITGPMLAVVSITNTRSSASTTRCLVVVGSRVRQFTQSAPAACY